MEEESIIDKLKFKGTWKPYQKKVLDELDVHLNDQKLNVVIAPEAGKTILGIEVLRRLKNPAFILTSTITTKNQWKQKIIDNFLSDSSNWDLISTDIKNISDITISTYQGLQTVYKTREDKENLLFNLMERGVNTLILDEAHHLSSDWFMTLKYLADELHNDNFKIVSLTETPPYDLPLNEWQNYNSLNGNIDTEISAPELVKFGDLCPYQDLIYFSDLTEEEMKIVFDFEKNRADFMEYLHENADLIFTIITSDFIKCIDSDSEVIYNNIDFTISLISYLLSLDESDMNAGILTEFLGLEKELIPKFDYNQAQTLLNGILGKHSSMFNNTLKLKSKLREHRLINNNTVDLTVGTDFKKLFARSNSKLAAILDITKLESECLKEDLREVILLDYIGKEDREGLNVISVFEKISSLSVPFAVLTGTLVTIPKAIKEELYEFLDYKNINREKVITSEFDENNLKVEKYGNIDIVSIITEMFERGSIKVLIGTASLLCEGWSSRVVNTLIIASGSSMLMNQMRGMALRADNNNPSKTSDIWHLVALSKSEYKSHDFLTVQNCFKTFEGINFRENKIQNGLERLIPYSFDKIDISKINSQMSEYAKNRNELKTKWYQIFSESENSEIKISPMVYNVIEGGKTQKLILSQDTSNTYSYMINKISLSRKTNKLNFAEKQFLNMCCSMKLIKEDYEKIIDDNFRIFNREARIKAMARVLLETLCELFIIKTPKNKIKLFQNPKYNTDYYLTLLGCSDYERNVFISSFAEIFKINEKNSYILRRNGEYFGVPECIAVNKISTELFVEKLEQTFGGIDLINTKMPKGRKELVKAIFNDKKSVEIKKSRVWI